MRLDSADESIFDTRMRPKVVSSASSSQERRNTSSGSRNESLPKSSEPADLAAALMTDGELSDGHSIPAAAVVRPPS